MKHEAHTHLEGETRVSPCSLLHRGCERQCFADGIYAKVHTSPIAFVVRQICRNSKFHISIVHSATSVRSMHPPSAAAGLTLIIRAISPSTSEVYEKFMDVDGKQSVSLGDGVIGHWIGRLEARNVLIWFHGL